MTNTILDRTGSPAYTWLLALMYICFILNHAYNSSIQGIPLQKATGSTPDISPLLRFHWWQPVYYKEDDSDFPSDSPEKRGHFVGIAENVGHAMTFKILTDDTHKVISRSNVRSADNPSSLNLRLDHNFGDLNPPLVVKSRHDDENGDNTYTPMPTFDPNDIIGRTFLLPNEDDGQRFRARIVEAIDEFDNKLAVDPSKVKFRCSINDNEYEDILSYHDILQYLDDDNKDDTYWKFRRITAHEGPLPRTHPN